MIVSGGFDRTVRVWDLESGEAVGEALCGHYSPVTAVAVGQRGGHAVIVSGGDDGTVRVWDLENLSPEKVVHVEAAVKAVALTQDARIVVGSSKGLMLLDWNPQ